MIKLYPDRPVPAILRGLADLIVIGWTILWAMLGWLIYKTVLGLEVIADGLTSTGHTFNGWIKQFHDAIPGGIPGVTQFLINVADALRKYSGDPLVSAGHQVHDAIIQVAIVLALLVALPPILLVLVPYGAWRWRDMREIRPALALGRIPSATGRWGAGRGQPGEPVAWCRPAGGRGSGAGGGCGRRLRPRVRAPGGVAAGSLPPPVLTIWVAASPAPI